MGTNTLLQRECGQRDSFHNRPFVFCLDSAISFLFTCNLDLFVMNQPCVVFCGLKKAEEWLEGYVCIGRRRPAACFSATWHAHSLRHCRPLPSWMMLAVRLVCHKEESQLPPNTQPSVCIHDGTLSTDKEKQGWQYCKLERSLHMQTNTWHGYCTCSLCRNSKLSSVYNHINFQLAWRGRTRGREKIKE